MRKWTTDMIILDNIYQTHSFLGCPYLTIRPRAN